MKLNFSYRPDIDGLRALAVLLVVAFHADFPFVSGGFIGVDVFFVLSGFLITFTINKEMIANEFFFKQFYLRRIRRIIPVLFFVILVSIVPAYLFLLSNHFEAYSRTILHSMLSTNNIHLWITQRDYFSEDSNLVPFLHTWSLSVEEQFYFLWPVLLLFLHKIFHLRNRLIFISIFLVASVFLSIHLTNTNHGFAYFLLPARIFELAIGASLAMFWDKLPELKTLVNNFLSIVGILFVLIPAYFLNNLSLFPGINAFWPCLGTAILIFTGKSNHNKGLVNSFFQNKVLVQTGLLSYSIYLWHWPVFIFIKYIGINLTGLVRIYAVILVFILSYLSWKFVEQPFRIKFKYNFNKTFWFGFLPILIFTTAVYAIIDKKDGFPERFPTLSEFNPKTNFPNKVREQCFDKFKIGNCEECFLGIKKDTLDGMLIGDSFGNHTAAFLDILAKDAGLYIHDSTAGGYPVLNNLNDDGSPTNDTKYAAERLEYAKKFKTIFIAANWDEQSSPESKNYQFIISTIGKLVQEGKKIVIFDCLRATTEMNLHKAKLLKTGKKVYFSERDFSIPEYKRPTNYIVYELKRQFPSIMIINLNDGICKDGKCNIQIDNTIIYRNFNHLNTSGAELLAKNYLKIKGNPLKKLQQ